MVRQFKGSRNTKETQIDIKLDLDSNEYNINTGIGFFDHMLELLLIMAHLGLN